ncbi:hypothetical protein Tco_0414868 [Tanacetum coccineum]
MESNDGAIPCESNLFQRTGKYGDLDVTASDVLILILKSCQGDNLKMNLPDHKSEPHGIRSKDGDGDTSLLVRAIHHQCSQLNVFQVQVHQEQLNDLQHSFHNSEKSMIK